MKKCVFALFAAFMTIFVLLSCVEEDGAGVPAAKRMYLQNDEYTVDLNTDTIPLTLRWIDVTNATYEVIFSNDANDNTETLDNEIKKGNPGTLFMEIPYSRISQYIKSAALLPDTNKKLDIIVTVKGSVINASQPSVLTTKGDKVSAVIHVSSVE
jgi:hypothetical protein